MANHFWYEAPTEDLAGSIWEHVRQVEQEQAPLHRKNLCHARLYANRLEPGLHGSYGGSLYGAVGGVTENIIRSVVDTATAIVAKSRPKVTFLTEGGSWDEVQLAEQLEQFMLGMFHKLRVYYLAPLVFRDACIFGTGVLKLSIGHDNEIHLERVLVDDIIVDESTVPYGEEPLEMHHVRRVPRATLIRLYPDKEDTIKEASNSRSLYGYDEPYRNNDMVTVVESWRRGPKGRHVLAVSSGVLSDTPYNKDGFPFVAYRWSPPITGWYGQGLAEDLLGFQVRLNELNEFIQKAQDLFAVPRVFFDASTKTFKPQLDNTIGAIIPYVGRPPQFFTPQAVGSEIYAYKEQLKQSAFEFAGISRMAAHATRPEGIEAGVALRELSDNQSQRFAIQQGRYEEMFMQLGQKLVELVHQQAKRGRLPKVVAANKFSREIDWPAADFEKHRFTMRIAPSSMISETPSGKLSTIIELAQYGVQFTPEEIRDLLDHPDLKRSNTLATAQRDYTEWVISELRKGRMVAPDKFMDLQNMIPQVNAAYLVARRTGAPERVQEMFRQWLLLAQQEQEELMAEAQARVQEAAVAQPGQRIPLGNIAETGLPGVLPPTADTDDTLLPGLVNALGAG